MSNSDSSADEIWPVYTGKSFGVWEPDTGNFYDSANAETIQTFLREKSNADEGASLPCQAARIAFRDVTRSTDARTMIPALVPPKTILGEKAPYLVRTHGDVNDEAFVLGVMSSAIFDWQARRVVELKMSFEILKTFSIPDPGVGDSLRDRVSSISGRLAASDDRFSDWAAALGIAIRPMSADESASLCAELDACVALLYGLDESDVSMIFETFGRPGQWDARRDAVLAEMARIVTAETSVDAVAPQ